MPNDTTTQDIQPLSEYRAHIAEYHRRVHETGRPLFVNTNGRTSVVVLSPETYDRLIEKAALVEDVAAIRKGIEDLKTGGGRNADEVMREIAADLGMQPDR